MRLSNAVPTEMRAPRRGPVLADSLGEEPARPDAARSGMLDGRDGVNLVSERQVDTPWIRRRLAAARLREIEIGAALDAATRDLVERLVRVRHALTALRPEVVASARALEAARAEVAAMIEDDGQADGLAARDGAERPRRRTVISDEFAYTVLALTAVPEFAFNVSIFASVFPANPLWQNCLVAFAPTVVIAGSAKASGMLWRQTTDPHRPDPRARTLLQLTLVAAVCAIGALAWFRFTADQRIHEIAVDEAQQLCASTASAGANAPTSTPPPSAAGSGTALDLTTPGAGAATTPTACELPSAPTPVESMFPVVAIQTALFGFGATASALAFDPRRHDMKRILATPTREHRRAVDSWRELSACGATLGAQHRHLREEAVAASDQVWEQALVEVVDYVGGWQAASGLPLPDGAVVPGGPEGFELPPTAAWRDRELDLDLPTLDDAVLVVPDIPPPARPPRRRLGEPAPLRPSPPTDGPLPGGAMAPPEPPPNADQLPPSPPSPPSPSPGPRSVPRNPTPSPDPAGGDDPRLVPGGARTVPFDPFADDDPLGWGRVNGR